MTDHQTLRATLSDLAGRALDTFSETTGFVAVRDRLHHPGGDDYRVHDGDWIRHRGVS